MVDNIITAISEILNSDFILRNNSELKLTYKLSDDEFNKLHNILLPNQPISENKVIIDYSIDEKIFLVEIIKN